MRTTPVRYLYFSNALHTTACAIFVFLYCVAYNACLCDICISLMRCLQRLCDICISLMRCVQRLPVRYLYFSNALRTTPVQYLYFSPLFLILTPNKVSRINKVFLVANYHFSDCQTEQQWTLYTRNIHRYKLMGTLWWADNKINRSNHS